MKTKPFYQSKTLWVQLISVLSLLVPAVNTWVSTNPIGATSVFAAINTLVRFVTHGKISPFEPGVNSGGGLNLLMLGVMSMAAACVLGLSSCSALGDLSLESRASYRDPNTGAKAGMVFKDGRFVPYAKVPFLDGDGNVIGEFEVVTPDAAK